MGYLDPPEICKLAKLNRAFRCASSADFIWESKLPPNYQSIVIKVFGEGLENLGKRDIYAKLSKSNPFDDGTKTVWRELLQVQNVEWSELKNRRRNPAGDLIAGEGDDFQPVEVGDGGGEDA